MPVQTHEFDSRFTMPDTVAPILMSVDELAKELNDPAGVRLLDVRTPGEFESVHIPGSYNVPLDTLGEHGAEICAAAGLPLVLVCQSGQRARKAELALRTVGNSGLRVLEGGMSGWLGAGQPVVRGRPRMSLERQVRIAAGAMVAMGGMLALFVDPLFATIPAFVGTGLVFAGVTDTCALGMMLARLPYNRVSGGNIGAVLESLGTCGVQRSTALQSTRN